MISPIVYKTLFNEIEDNYKRLGWNSLFTDASKSIDGTSYAVVTKDGCVISTGLLYFTSSTFTAEAYATLKAINSAKNKKKHNIYRQPFIFRSNPKYKQLL